MNRRLLDDLGEQLNQLLPRAGALGEETRQQVHSAIRRAVSRLDLPDREEFERQREALERAEQRIAELEDMVAALEESQRKARGQPD